MQEVTKATSPHILSRWSQIYQNVFIAGILFAFLIPRHLNLWAAYLTKCDSVKSIVHSDAESRWKAWELDGERARSP